MIYENLIIGAIAGDIIGSPYEWNNQKTKDFDLFIEQSTFTDDSVLTIATMDVLINNGNYKDVYQAYGRKYSNKGYGHNFRLWLQSDNPMPYNSQENGSAIRLSPVKWDSNTLEKVMYEAKRSAVVIHDHPEGFKVAHDAASAIYFMS